MFNSPDKPGGVTSELGASCPPVAPPLLNTLRGIPAPNTEYRATVDVEWDRHPTRPGENAVVALGLRFDGNGQSVSRVILASGPDRRNRITLGTALGKIISAALPLIDGDVPGTITVAMHFGRGDLAAFRDFADTKRKVDSVRNSFVTTGKPAELDVDIRSTRVSLPPELGAKHPLKVVFRDTYLHVPEGHRKSLDAIGEHFGLRKLELPEGYSKADMGRFFREKPGQAEGYLLRDLEITALFYQRLDALYRRVGLTGVPATMASAAVKLFFKALSELKDSNGQPIGRDRLLGVERRKQKRYSKARARFTTTTTTELTFARQLFEAAMGLGYHGGRTESYRTGVSRAAMVINDIDACQAYPTAMAGLRLPDYARAFMSTNVDDFTASTLGVAEIEFDTDEELRFPVFGVRTEHGLVFPRHGRTVAGAPEIAAAVHLGVRVRMLQGVVIPWADEEVYPYAAFFKMMIALRIELKQDGRDTLESLIVKTIANALYGRTAQAVRQRNVFDSRTGGTRPLPRSPITNAAFAAYTTSLVRAMMAEAMNGVPKDRQVLSVSTDGFTSTATIEEIDTSGPACRVMAENRARLGGSPAILEYKKHVQQLVLPRSRAAFTAGLLDGHAPILARGSIKVPAGEADANAYLLGLYLDRKADTTVEREDFVPLRQQWEEDGDLVTEKHITRLNLEPDMKRRLVRPEMVEIASGSFAGRQHLSTDSEPYDTVGEMIDTRRWFESWRDATGRCLKDLSDWEDWQDYLETTRAAEQAGRRSYRTAGGSADALKRQFLRALVRGEWGVGLGARSYRSVAEWLTAAGYKTSEASVKNAKRGSKGAGPARRGDAPLVSHSVACTPKTLELLKAILIEFPGFRFEEAFVAGHLPRVREALEGRR